MPRSLIIKIHIAYWCLFGPMNFLAFSWPYYETEAALDYKVLFWISVTINRALAIGSFYWYYSVLIPKFLFKRRRVLGFVLATLATYVVTMCFYSLIWNIAPLYDGGYKVYWVIEQAQDLFSTVGYLPIIAIAARLVEEWTTSEMDYRRLKRLTTASKIGFLKSQINPHFIFNTLNNIYSLSLNKGTEKTSEALDKFQDTFRYLKKVENKSKIDLFDAIEYIKSYVDLSKLRLTNPECVALKVEVGKNSRSIYPMLLIPFIENAFKHAYLADKNSFIRIHLRADDDNVHLEVMNSISSKNKSKDSLSGVGLENVKARLELFFKKGDYSMESKEQGETYKTSISFPYASV